MCRLPSPRWPNTQRSALSLAESRGELLQVFLATRGFTEHGQQDQGTQAKQGIGFDAVAVFAKLLEVFDDGADLPNPLRAPNRHLGFDPRQPGLELLGLKVAAGLAVQRTHQQTLGLGHFQA